jgi:hypothetical protein
VRLGHIARWTLRAVPGIYGAARSAGLGHRDAARVLQASAYALLIARKRHPRQWRAENAVRHFAWQAWLAGMFGADVAGAVGRAHERLSGNVRDSEIDQENNRLGREHGLAHAQSIRAQAMRPALSALADEAGRLWEAGLLGRAT